ncbi:nuclear transport factor 2 family protein, partial [Mesorhizobium sp. M00.F.Ca.ET.170.01.1.1]
MTQELTIDVAAAKRSAETAEIMRRYNHVFQRHDPSALDELVAEDCVIENTTPAPDGARRVGKAACVELWSAIATGPGTR